MRVDQCPQAGPHHGVVVGEQDPQGHPPIHGRVETRPDAREVLPDLPGQGEEHVSGSTHLSQGTADGANVRRPLEPMEVAMNTTRVREVRPGPDHPQQGRPGPGRPHLPRQRAQRAGARSRTGEVGPPFVVLLADTLLRSSSAWWPWSSPGARGSRAALRVAAACLVDRPGDRAARVSSSRCPPSSSSSSRRSRSTTLAALVLMFSGDRRRAPVLD